MYEGPSHQQKLSLDVPTEIESMKSDLETIFAQKVAETHEIFETREAARKAIKDNVDIGKIIAIYSKDAQLESELTDASRKQIVHALGKETIKNMKKLDKELLEMKKFLVGMMEDVARMQTDQIDVQWVLKRINERYRKNIYRQNQLCAKTENSLLYSKREVEGLARTLKTVQKNSKAQDYQFRQNLIQPTSAKLKQYLSLCDKLSSELDGLHFDESPPIHDADVPRRPVWKLPSTIGKVQEKVNSLFNTEPPMTNEARFVWRLLRHDICSIGKNQTSLFGALCTFSIHLYNYDIQTKKELLNTKEFLTQQEKQIHQIPEQMKRIAEVQQRLDCAKQHVDKIWNAYKENAKGFE